MLALDSRSLGAVLRDLPYRARRRVARILMAFSEVADSDGVIDLRRAAGVLGVTPDYFKYRGFFPYVSVLFPSCLEKIDTWRYRWACGDIKEAAAAVEKSLEWAAGYRTRGEVIG